MTLEQRQLNTEKILALASLLFPEEEWINHGKNIFVAKSRLTGGHKELAKLYREISDVRILTARGSEVFFLPENVDKNAEKDETAHNMHADTVIDGVAFVFLRLLKSSFFGPMTNCGQS
jgi:hypothetical protein